MHAADYYYSQIRKLPSQDKSYAENVRRAFRAALRDLPSAFVEDVLDFYSTIYTGPKNDFSKTAEHLVFVIELFTGSYDDGNDAFEDAEWDFFRDIIDEHAGELSMDLVTEVMQLILSKGKL